MPGLSTAASAGIHGSMTAVAGTKREQPGRRPWWGLGAAAATVAHRPGLWLTALVVVALCSVVAAWLTATSKPVLSTDMTFDESWTWQSQEGALELGVTHTDSSILRGGSPAAAERAEAVLRSTGRLQNQHLMGWGALNPEPSPGRYEWQSLDARMQLIERTGGSTLLTLAVAPDWMKGGEPGTTDWSRIEVAPTREHFDDFAALAARAVQRYPQVERVQVWNELKGFYDTGRNKWDYEGYTDLYNAVYDEVKAVRPDVEVGGPYISMNSWTHPDEASHPSDVSGAWGVLDQRSLDVVEYWLDNAHGFDFLVVDGGSGTRDEGALDSSRDGAAKFAAVTTWLRERSSVPIWWAEFYPDVPSAPGPESAEQSAATLEAIAAFLTSGTSGALLWQPETTDFLEFSGLWTRTSDPNGGAPTPLTEPWAWLVPRAATGGVDVGRQASGGPLTAFRASDGVLLVNGAKDEVVLGSGQSVVTLPPWGTAIIPSLPDEVPG